MGYPVGKKNRGVERRPEGGGGTSWRGLRVREVGGSCAHGPGVTRHPCSWLEHKPRIRIPVHGQDERVLASERLQTTGREVALSSFQSAVSPASFTLGWPMELNARSCSRKLSPRARLVAEACPLVFLAMASSKYIALDEEC